MAMNVDRSHLFRGQMTVSISHPDEDAKGNSIADDCCAKTEHGRQCSATVRVLVGEPRNTAALPDCALSDATTWEASFLSLSSYLLLDSNFGLYALIIDCFYQNLYAEITTRFYSTSSVIDINWGGD